MKHSFILFLIIFLPLIYLAFEDRFSNETINIPVFKEVSKETGLADTTKTFSAAAGNFTPDFYPDLLLSKHGTLVLYKNRGEGVFAPPMPVGIGNRDTHGVSCVDFNNDGMIDIMLSTGAERGFGECEKEVYLNSKFEFYQLKGLSPVINDIQGRGRTIVPWDFNLDGLLDFIMSNHYQAGRPHRFAIATGKNNEFVELEGLYNLKNANSSKFLPLKLFADERDFILLCYGNDGGKIFQRTSDTSYFEVTKQLGIQSDPQIQKVLPFDFDNDGDVDLLFIKGLHETYGTSVIKNKIFFKYAGKQFEQKSAGFTIENFQKNFNINIIFNSMKKPEFLYLGKSRQISSKWPVPITEKTDLSGDPNVDPANDKGCFLWMDDYDIIHFQCVGSSIGFQDISGFFEFEENVSNENMRIKDFGVRNNPKNPEHVLYKNQSNRYFSPVTQIGLISTGFAHDAVAEDFNNDGFTDIFLVNGGYHFINPPDQLFLNQQDGTFLDVTKKAGIGGTDVGKGDGCLAFDYDMDGDIDVFVFNGCGSWPNEGPLQLFNNTFNTPSNSIKIYLEGTQSNSQGWGASLFLFMKNGTLLKQKHPANHHFATSDIPLHIGLGNNTQIDSLKVLWPSHKTEVFRNIPSGSVILINESNGIIYK